MDLKSILYFLAVLSVLVVVHEWGHFIVAKMCKMRVEDFSLFFGKRLIRLGVRNGTEYNIRSIPLGGFVKIAGMEPEETFPAPFVKVADSSLVGKGSSLVKQQQAMQRQIANQKGPLAWLTNDVVIDEHRPDGTDPINFENISPRIREVVAGAIGDDARLTPDGLGELKVWLTSPNINTDEHRYITTILHIEGIMSVLPDPDGYNQKPLWQRAAVIFAGPFLSLAFGYLLFCAMGMTTGLPDPKQISVGDLVPGKPAQLAGLKKGDWIQQINGKPITNIDEMHKPIYENAGRPITLVISRDGTPMNFTITPYAEEAEILENGKKVKKSLGHLGFMPSSPWRRYSPAAAIGRGTEIIYEEVAGTLTSVSHPRDFGKNSGGILMIGSIIHQNSQEGPAHVLFVAALLSVSLGIMNLFPIPVLDGGHLLLLAIEGIRRRKLSIKEVATAQMIGLSLIAALFLFVMYNDIMKLLPHK